MRPHRNRTAISFSTAFAQISDQFLARVELGAGWLNAIEIANQTDSESDVIKKIAVDMTAVDLTAPSVADLDFTIAGRGAIADYEMIRQPVLHPPHVSMVVVEHPRISLSGAAVMDNDEFPPVAGYWRPPDFFDH